MNPNHPKGRFNPYPAYKPSGVPWLGDVPAHWGVRRGKRLFRKMERPVREGDDVVTCFRDGLVTLRKNRRQLGFTESLKEIGYQGIRRGDLVIHAMDAFAGDIGVSDSDGKGTPVYSVCKHRQQANAYYYAYALREMSRNRWIEALAKGIRERSSDFRYTEFGSQLLPLPPLPEQAAIVRNLDHADRRIRRYIGGKERLIALLEEEKQAIINQAVIRGLDPNVPLKPSGVQWLGDVPEHWELRRLKSVGRIRYGLGQPPLESPTGLPLIRATNVSRGRIVEKDLLYVDPKEIPVGRDAFLREKEIIVVRSRAYTADSAIVPKAYAGSVTGYDMVVTVTEAIPEFIAVALLSEYLRDDQLVVARSRAAQPHLNAEELGTSVVLLPPLSEQSAIVSHVDQATARIGAATSAARRQIELLREYRTRLISDVVTGKLDVREAAANLPDESDEENLVFGESFAQAGTHESRSAIFVGLDQPTHL